MTTVDVVIPVYNEEHVLQSSIERLREFLRQNLEVEWRVVIADNASTDRTLQVAQELAASYPEVDYIHLDLKGRGRALRQAWLASQADIVSYMDVDLSTGLEAFPKLVSAIQEGYDLAVGSRLKRGAQTTRSLKREVISRIYNLIIRAAFQTRFSDAQCGFKALSRKAAAELVPLVENQEWFFDSELLILAEKKGYRVADVPVRWVEDPDTRVKIGSTAWEDLKGLWRLRTHRIP